MTHIDDATRIRHVQMAAARAMDIAATVNWTGLRTDSVEALAIAHLVEILGEAAGKRGLKRSAGAVPDVRLASPLPEG